MLIPAILILYGIGHLILILRLNARVKKLEQSLKTTVQISTKLSDSYAEHLKVGHRGFEIPPKQRT